jgi:hypothetical protein
VSFSSTDLERKTEVLRRDKDKGLDLAFSKEKYSGINRVCQEKLGHRYRVL